MKVLRRRLIVAMWVAVGAFIGCGSDGGPDTDTDTDPDTDTTPDPDPDPDPSPIDEVEPNGSPDGTGAQDVGSFTEDTTLVIKGELSSGGNNGTSYTGDFDLFTFNAAPGSVSIRVEWTASADVDAALYNAMLNQIAADGSTANPAVLDSGAINGSYILGLFSKDNPAPYTVTITYTKSTTTTPECNPTPVVAAMPSGGCNLTLTTPACSTGNLSNGGVFELAYTTNMTFCEGPHHLQVAGDPPSSWQNGNYVDFELSSFHTADERYGMTRDIGGYLRINASDIAGLTSSTGIYYYAVRSFHGSQSEVIPFVIEQ